MTTTLTSKMKVVFLLLFMWCILTANLVLATDSTITKKTANATSQQPLQNITTAIDAAGSKTPLNSNSNQVANSSSSNNATSKTTTTATTTLKPKVDTAKTTLVIETQHKNETKSTGAVVAATNKVAVTQAPAVIKNDNSTAKPVPTSSTTLASKNSIDNSSKAVTPSTASTSTTKTTTTTTTTTSTTTTTTTTTTPKPPRKPKITISSDVSIVDENIAPINNKNNQQLPLDNTAALPVEEVQAAAVLQHQVSNKLNPNNDYIVPIVTVILTVPLAIGVVITSYRRFRDFWSTRHYRRMDFLLDGMYND